jgi:hypothetical protein
MGWQAAPPKRSIAKPPKMPKRWPSCWPAPPARSPGGPPEANRQGSRRQTQQRPEADSARSPCRQSRPASHRAAAPARRGSPGDRGSRTDRLAGCRGPGGPLRHREQRTVQSVPRMMTVSSSGASGAGRLSVVVTRQRVDRPPMVVGLRCCSRSHPMPGHAARNWFLRTVVSSSVRTTEVFGG